MYIKIIWWYNVTPKANSLYATTYKLTKQKKNLKLSWQNMTYKS